MRRLPRLLLLLLVLLLCACGPAPVAPQLTAPWAPGDTSWYTGMPVEGAVSGTATLTWSAPEEGLWVLTHQLDLQGQVSGGQVRAGDPPWPRAASLQRGETTLEVEYGEDTIVVRQGDTVRASVPRPAHVVDQDQLLGVLRALPLAEGYATVLQVFDATAGQVVPTRVEVAGQEGLTVPAGTWPAWKLLLSSGGRPQEVWVAQDPPHPLLRFHNPRSGFSLELRAFQVTTDAPVAGAPEPPEEVLPDVAARPAMLAAVLGVQLPLMLVVPVVLLLLARRHLGASWRVLGWGALAFVAAKIAHVALNGTLATAGTPRGLGLLPLPLLALAAGLVAGLAQEGVRWAFLKWLVPGVRDRDGAGTFGLGHGAAEAVVLALLAALSLATAWTVARDPTAVPEEARAAMVGVAHRFFTESAWIPMAGGLERVAALVAHVGYALLVARSLLVDRPAPVVVAIAAHALLEAWTVAGPDLAGPVAAALVAALGSAAVLWLGLRAWQGDAPAAEAAPGT